LDFHQQVIAHTGRTTPSLCEGVMNIDDFGLQELTEEQQRDLYRIIAERYENPGTHLSDEPIFFLQICSIT